MSDFLKAIFGGSSLPKVVRARLIINRLIRIDDKVFFTEDRYATPEQIATVTNQNMHLKVTGGSLPLLSGVSSSLCSGRPLGKGAPTDVYINKPASTLNSSPTLFQSS